MEKNSGDHWSECGQIFFLDSMGWGLTDKLKTICLGSEETIKEFFTTGKLNGQLHPYQKEVLKQILEYRQEQGIGKQSGTAGMERTGRNGVTRSQPKATRPLTPKQRLPLRTPRTKNKGVSS